MSLKRRLELLDWARAAGGFVLEDDYDSEYRYAGRPLAALQGLDRDGRVIYVGTMSKVMFPGLRVGYMVVPEQLIDGVPRGAGAGRRPSLLDRPGGAGRLHRRGPSRARTSGACARSTPSARRR